MAIKIRKELNTVVTIHQRIINALKSQKARQDAMLEKYQNDVESEIQIPSNRMMLWVRAVSPYMDAVISSKLLDYELIKNFEKFIKEIIEYEQDYIVSESDILELEDSFDRLVEILLHLEKTIIELKKESASDLITLRRRLIKLYQKQPDDILKRPDHCRFCGIKLDPGAGDIEKECQDCASMPEKAKPFLRKIVEPFKETSLIENDDLDDSQDTENSDNDQNEDPEPDDQDHESPEDPEPSDTNNEQKDEIEKIPGETRTEKRLRKEFNKLMVNYKRRYQKDLEEKQKYEEGGDEDISDI